MFDNLEKRPPFPFNSANPPSSKTFPFSRTKILSQPSIVLILWAIMTVVVSFIAFDKASYTFFWEVSSKAEVASSRIRIFGFLMIVLAIATLCFWPPDNDPPLIPQTASKPELSTMSFNFSSLLSISPATASNAPFFLSSSAHAFKSPSSSSYFA